MNKKILSIFALIMAISILGVSCSENPADPNNGGSTTGPTAQYPQTSVPTADVEKILDAIQTAGKDSNNEFVVKGGADKDKNILFAIGDATISSQIFGAYGSSEVATAQATTALDANIVVAYNDVLAAINAAIKNINVATDLKGTEIASISPATIFSKSPTKIVIAIDFKDTEGNNGVIALTLTSTAQVNNNHVDFGDAAATMTKVTDAMMKQAIVEALNGMKIGTAATATVSTDNIAAASVAGGTTFTVSGVIADGTQGSLAEVKKSLNPATQDGEKRFDLLKEKFAAIGVSITSDYADAGVEKDTTTITIGKAASTPLDVARIAGSGYYYDATASTGTDRIAASKMTIELKATSGNWGA